MSKLDDVGAANGWRCWLCDEPVDATISVNDPRGPSVDSVITKAKSKRNGPSGDRLAHRACNTRKGAIAPVVRWAEHLFVVEPAPIMTAVERLERKGGRELMARFTSAADAQAAADWLVDRVSRLAPALGASADVETGGGQFLLVLRA